MPKGVGHSQMERPGGLHSRIFLHKKEASDMEKTQWFQCQPHSVGNSFTDSDLFYYGCPLSRTVKFNPDFFFLLVMTLPLVPQMYHETFSSFLSMSGLKQKEPKIYFP